MLDVLTKWEGLDEAFAALEAECTAVARGITVSAWKATLRETPQWSGAMAASWTYSINAPVFMDRSSQVPKLPYSRTYQKGDHPAVAVAAHASAGREMAFKLGDRVFFANGVEQGADGYADQIEEGTMANLRVVNKPGRPGARAIDEIEARWGLGVEHRAAGQLKNLRIAGAA
jgi:alkanesulfonate monooxygenase SsuD/methylene tetrahydromethanopterin reductase-like flavin-dependent oxidoreductase (luciferase family)